MFPAPRGCSVAHAGRSSAGGLPLLCPEVWDHILTKESNGVEHLMMLRRPNGTERKNFFNPQCLISFAEPDAVVRRPHAECGALLHDLVWCQLPWMRATGEFLITFVV